MVSFLLSLVFGGTHVDCTPAVTQVNASRGHLNRVRRGDDDRAHTGVLEHDSPNFDFC